VAETLVDPGRHDRPSPAAVAVHTGSVVRPGQRSMLGLGILAGAGAMAVVAALVIAFITTTGTPAAGGSGTAPIAPTMATLPRSSEPASQAAESRAQPSAVQSGAEQPGTAEPSTAQPRTAKVTAARPTTATTRSRPPTDSPTAAAPRRTTRTTTPVAPRTADTGRDEPDLAQALSGLQGAVGEVTSAGQIDAKRADELTKRVDVLSQQLEQKSAADATRRVDELDKYLAGLARKDELTPTGQERISTALSGVRDAVAPR
jgi:hypothetical protein